MFSAEKKLTINIGLDVYSVMNVPTPMTGLETKLVIE